MTSQAIERIEVHRSITASAAKIFRVLRDPRGHVAVDASGMLQDATGEPVSAVGDTFVVHMDREALNDHPLGRYDVTVRIVAFELDREIAWTIEGIVDPPIPYVYGYRLGHNGGDTVVTSYCDWSRIDDERKRRGVFPVIAESTLRATLGILARTVQ